MSNDWQSIVALTGAILIAYGVILWIGTLVWTYRDIRERTRDQVLHWVCPALVILFNIPGLILYLLLRPTETLGEAYERRLETEAIRRDLAGTMHACPSCARPIEEEFLVCPFCRNRLRVPCSSCAKPLELAWVICPYCGAAGPQPMPAAAAAPAPAPQTVAYTPPPTPAPAQSTAAPPPGGSAT